MQALFLRMDINQHCICYPFISPYSYADHEHDEQVHIKDLSQIKRKKGRRENKTAN